MTNESKSKILIVDDTRSIRNILQRILTKQGYDIDMAEDGEAGLEKVFDWLPDLVLLDVMMPKMDGMEVCQHIRRDHKYNFIYIIMLTAKANPEDEVTGLDLGADDYVVKPFNTSTLLARIRRGLQLVDERKCAVLDPLTNLYNRRIFNMLLKQETEIFRRYHHPLSLILIDLDYFKTVNDTFGHKAGDLVLQEIARILKKTTRRSDLVVRWGGEELAVLLPKTDRKGAEMVAENLRRKIEEHKFPEVGHVTASFGVSAMTDADADMDMDTDMVQAADIALYQAKQSGRNKVVICDW